VVIRITNITGFTAGARSKVVSAPNSTRVISQWTAIVSPLLTAFDRKWFDKVPAFWESCYELFRKDYDRLSELEQAAWKSYQAGDSMMIVRVKVNAYFDLINKLAEKVYEARRKTRSPGVQDSNIPGA
jgi:hypothetical protein